MNEPALQTALLILPEDYRQNAFEFLTEHTDYTPEDFIKFIKDQLDQMQRAYEYELQDKDDEIASLQNDYEASEYGYDDLQDDFEDLNDDYDKLEEKIGSSARRKRNVRRICFRIEGCIG